MEKNVWEIVYTPCVESNCKDRHDRAIIRITKCKQRSTTSASMRLNRISVVILSVYYILLYDQLALTHRFADASTRKSESQGKEQPSVDCRFVSYATVVWTAWTIIYNIDGFMVHFIRKQLCACVIAVVYSPNMYCVVLQSLLLLLIANYLMIVFLVSYSQQRNTMHTHSFTV